MKNIYIGMLVSIKNKKYTVVKIRKYNIDAKDKNGKILKGVGHDEWLYVNSQDFLINQSNQSPQE